jgi:hypothetical protein
MLTLSGSPTIKSKSIDEKSSNAGVQGSSPTDMKTHLVLVTFFQLLTGAILKTVVYDRLVVIICKIANENVVITKKDRLNSSLRQSRNMHPSSFINPPSKT